LCIYIYMCLFNVHDMCIYISYKGYGLHTIYWSGLLGNECWENRDQTMCFFREIWGFGISGFNFPLNQSNQWMATYMEGWTQQSFTVQNPAFSGDRMGYHWKSVSSSVPGFHHQRRWQNTMNDWDSTGKMGKIRPEGGPQWPTSTYYWGWSPLGGLLESNL
jgi:hypothetical protein